MKNQADRRDPAPRWLTADELAAWRSFMNLAWRLPDVLDAELQRDAQLSFMEYYVLALLADEPGRRMRMSRLAATVNAELSRLSHMIKRLETRGLVRREPDPGDGRFTDAVLTDDGRSYQADAALRHVGRVRELFVDPLDRDELRTLRRCALKVTARIEEDAAERPPPARRR